MKLEESIPSSFASNGNGYAGTVSDTNYQPDTSIETPTSDDHAPLPHSEQALLTGHAGSQRGTQNGQESYYIGAGRSDVMLAYMETMDRFLMVQHQIMQSFLQGSFAPIVEGHRRYIAAPQRSVRPAPAPTVAVQQPAAPPQPTRVMPASPLSAPMSAPPPVAPPEPASVRPQVEVESAPLPEAAEAPHVEEAAGNHATLQRILVQLVSERTGYPVEMLDPTLDLEADLGIDSIKRVEIIGSLQQQTGIELGAQVEDLAARKTLAEMVEFLSDL